MFLVISFKLLFIIFKYYIHYYKYSE